MKNIEYFNNREIDLDDFIELYKESTLGERRPVDDRAVMEQMKNNSSVTISAWCEGKLVGISRSLTDLGYVAYLADLAVHQSFQKCGIGKELIKQTRAALGNNCMLVLLAAPKANEYYPSIGFTHNPRAWVLGPSDDIKG